MSSLQTALPNAQLSSTFLCGVSQPWFPQNPVTPYFPGTPQGSRCFFLLLAVVVKFMFANLILLDMC